MKSLITLFSALSLFSIINTAFGQDYMDEIAIEACKCLDDIPDTLDENTRNLQLGICMLENAEKYRKKIKKDYKVDIDKDGEELGRIIGMRMATKCPTSLMRLVEQDTEDVEEEQVEGSKSITGTITQIETGDFITFSLKDSKGKTTKFIWLHFINSDIDLMTDYKSVIYEHITIEYTEESFFDPKINEYRTFNVIKSLERYE